MKNSDAYLHKRLCKFEFQMLTKKEEHFNDRVLMKYVGILYILNIMVAATSIRSLGILFPFVVLLIFLFPGVTKAIRCLLSLPLLLTMDTFLVK